MNRTFSRFAAALVASTSLGGAVQGVAVGGAAFVGAVASIGAAVDVNAATMSFGVDDAAGSSISGTAFIGTDPPAYTWDLLGATGTTLGASGATNLFEARFALQNAVAANTTRLWRLTLSGGTFDAGGFASIGVSAVSSATVALISGGTDASTTALLEMSTVSDTGTAAGDVFNADFTVDLINSLAPGTTLSLLGELALAADTDFQNPLETASGNFAIIAAGMNTGLTVGPTAIIDGATQFQQFSANSAGSVDTTNAQVGSIRFRSAGTASFTTLNADGTSTYDAGSAFGGAQTYTAVLTSPVSFAPGTPLTAVCLDLDANLTCGTGTDIAGTLDTTGSTATFTLDGAGIQALESASTTGAIAFLAIVSGTVAIDEGSWDATVTAVAATGNRGVGGATQANIAAFALGGLNAFLGPVLFGNPSFINVIRGTNGSNFTSDFFATVRDQATATVIGTAGATIASAVPPNGAFQLTIDDIVSSVGGSLTGINSLTVQVTCGCTGSAAALMLGGGVFSNVSSTVGDDGSGAGQ